MDWFEVIPSFMSAVASVAAAIAAIVALFISKRATAISESTALITHHKSATQEYVSVVKRLNLTLYDFDRVTSCIESMWPRELQSLDRSELGGLDPRPLRHVLHNGSEMLADYASGKLNRAGSGYRGMLSPLTHGLGALEEDEYDNLLKKADKTYSSFESVLGIPSKSFPITSAPAFRWVCHQLVKRVKAEDWKKTWQEAWLDGGWLDKYKTEYLKVSKTLVEARESLRSEKENLIHTSFPVSRNPKLSMKYEQILVALDCLIEDCDVELLTEYKNWEFDEDQSRLMLCSVALVIFARKQLEIIHGASNY